MLEPRQTRVFSVEVINMFQSKNQGGRDSEGRQAGAPGATANSNTPTPTPTNPGDAPGVASERHSGAPTQRIRRRPIRQRTDFVRVCKRERIYRHIYGGGEFAYNELISSTLPPPHTPKKPKESVRVDWYSIRRTLGDKAAPFVPGRRNQ